MSEFELEFTREMPIALFDVWFRGHVRAFELLGMDVRHAEGAYAVYEHGTARCFTRKGNIAAIKASISRSNPAHLAELLSQYERRYVEFVGNPALVREPTFLNDLVSGFVVAFVLGDMPTHSLRSDAQRLREGTEQLFPLLWEAMRGIAVDPEHAGVYTLDELRTKERLAPEEVARRSMCVMTKDGVSYGIDRPAEGTSSRGDHPDELRGVCASRGVVTGCVRLVHGVSSLDRVSSGDVIVAAMTSPAFLPAIRRAGAIVTDEGGLTCHAAIVSRELRKPCVIGTKYATQVLKDGDLVEVDADAGIVRVVQ